jgi:hypothetical protein
VTLQTRYEFTLPRGYVDAAGNVHRTGTMRLATARDELEPLRDPTVQGPDDPRLTIVVLARVIESLGDLAMVTSHEIEGLFAVDLAFLQDFYGVINFGNQEEYEELLRSQQDTRLLGTVAAAPVAPPASADAIAADTVPEVATLAAAAGGAMSFDESADAEYAPRSLRGAVEELPRRSV